jgi:hypothetical protein
VVQDNARVYRHRHVGTQLGNHLLNVDEVIPPATRTCASVRACAGENTCSLCTRAQAQQRIRAGCRVIHRPPGITEAPRGNQHCLDERARGDILIQTKTVSLRCAAAHALKPCSRAYGRDRPTPELRCVPGQS